MIQHPIIRRIVATIAAEHGCTIPHLLDRDHSHVPKVAEARRHAMAVVRWSTGLSYPEIGEMFGGRSHDVVLKAVRRWENELTRRHEKETRP